jgi:hypothetical protein
MTLIKDLIEIPKYIQRGDFVLRLTEGVDRAEETLRQYVVTPELERCFDNALAFIHSAAQSNVSKATYLHGSFGSGKSHFMAVLHLILQGNTTARAIPELAGVITKHNAWVPGMKFLLVPYHMIGAHDMESGILGGYADFVRRAHPEAPIPGVYLAEGLFRDARGLLETMGDEAFFARLNPGNNTTGGWGELGAEWNRDCFEAAMEAAPGSEERSRLISALVGTIFTSYGAQATRGEAYLPLDKGLSVISKHAQSLGYNAVILFLDELVLWLASHAADLRFVHQEGQKLAKLVEAQTPDRPIPIVSFVARQRDLSELIGDAVPGAERLNFSDALRHWEGRFNKITLEDRNLPAIAEKRVLKCKSEAARKELDAAFDQTAKIREAVMTTLLTSEGDRGMFRKVYPFSPALVRTLIAVSSVLQRERTALKVMMQLLVDSRDVLKVGDIVPVGDLFDVIAHGDEAFSQEMAIHFDNAKRLYHQKLLPLLERQYGRCEELEKRPYDDQERTAFRNDDRLVKTLLLSALVPEVEPLRGLTAERLAALNHGTIKTPIPGREGQEVLRRCRTWAASVGEIRIGSEANPTISVQLAGVDTEGIIQQASGIDNPGNRVRRVREMLFEQMGIEDPGELMLFHNFPWRNTTRTCEIVFQNIRELPDASLDNRDDDWKLVIDWPFDEPGRGPRDDLSKIQAYNQAHANGARTLCWIPAFFSDDARKDLGLLVILEHILSGERLGQYATHLSPQDRQAAKSLLENQRSVLRERVKTHLEAAYGLESIGTGSLDTAHEIEPNERFASLWPGFEPQPPVAANLAGALNGLLDQALSHQYPAAPRFEEEIKSSNLRKVYEQVSEAARSQDGRAAVDRALRPLLRHIANPLMLGEMAPDATHFVLGQHWKTHFNKKASETGDLMTVAELRKWLDMPKPMGLPKDVQNLVLLVFAEQTNRSFFCHGAPVPVEVTLTNLQDQFELREQRLPEKARWGAAIARAGSLFGVATSPLLNARNVAELSVAVKTKAKEVRAASQAYSRALQDRLRLLRLDAENCDRVKTAIAAVILVERIFSSGDDAVVEVLASAGISTSEAAMGAALSHAADLATLLETASWELLEAVEGLQGDSKPQAEEVVAKVHGAMQSDEHVIALAPVIKEAQLKSVRLLSQQRQEPQKETEAPLVAPPKPTPRAGRRVVGQGSRENLGLSEARALLQKLDGERKSDSEVRVNISWTIEQGGSES